MKREIIPAERIVQSIRYVRGHKVLLDSDLAILYGVATKALNQAVKRNRGRFPDDFMFQLNSQESRSLRSQSVTLKSGEHLKYRPYAFTEQDIAMLSSVPKSERAAKVNIAIMRAFVKLRQALETNRDLAQKFSELEQRIGKHDEEIAAILEAIRQLMAPPQKPLREIGFHVREKGARYRAGRRA